jgi:hypothetical protein
MKKKFPILILFFIVHHTAFGQNSFIGIQNSQRKSMHSVWMNPAEINHLHKKMEVNFFSVQGSFGNNIISFQDVLKDREDVLNMAFERADGPVNVRSNIEILGPSIGFKMDRWAFGLSTQAFASGHMIDLDPKLAESFSSNNFTGRSNIININSPFNQRVNISGWTEIGFTAGVELIRLAEHSLSVGGTYKLLFPYNYINVGVDQINGTLVQNDFEFSLTNTTGRVNLSYADEALNAGSFTFSINPFNFSQLSGYGVDLGANYKWKDPQGGSKLNAGLALRNIGQMRFGSNQTNNTYNINIPEGESFRIDQLEGSLEEINQQLVNSGYFSIDRQREGVLTNLPTLISAYGELKLSKSFYLSLYGQQRFNSENENTQLVAQNLFVLTPRLQFGNLEIYSPWTSYEVAGVTGGFGIRYGGFFMGSNSIITGLIADTKQADFHIGLSWGFGNN